MTKKKGLSLDVMELCLMLTVFCRLGIAPAPSVSCIFTRNAGNRTRNSRTAASVDGPDQQKDSLAKERSAGAGRGPLLHCLLSKHSL